MLIKKTPTGLLTAAFGEIRPAPSLIRFKAKVSGGPMNVMEYKLVSVHINVSCLDFRPPTIKDPEDSRTEPAEFVVVGLNSNSFSESEKATSIGSTVPSLFPLSSSESAPNTIKCRSTSDVITCNPTVGTLLAPEVVDRLTALTDIPLFSTQR